MKIRISKSVTKLVWMLLASSLFIYLSMSLLVYYFTNF